MRTLRFRVLGPLELSLDGAPVRLGGERQRALLALLLVRANRLVSREELIEQLFGDERSDGSSNAVHVAVSRLRRVLGAGGEAVLSTRPGGYVLEVAPEQLDAAEFERLLDEGRELQAAGDGAAALARLREALALWRGAVLSDVAPLEAVCAEARRLEELRLLAEMDRIDTALALGQDAELIPEIELLVTAHPARERLRAQLMLALYRAGRQAESLAVYRQTSAVLREELGLEPGPKLRALEQLVLHQDPVLGVAPPPGEPPSALVCPFKGLAFFDAADADYFCGRDRLISDLVARLAEWPLAGILGPSGIGKSSLLRAGLLPALAAGALPGSGSWRQVLLRPGACPLDELARSLGGAGLPSLLDGLAPGERIVIAVDQLEELFTVGADEEQRAAFLAQLVDATRDRERRAFVVVAVRADFYGRFADHPSFASLLSQSHVLVGPMQRSELAQAIVEPAARAGLQIEQPLVDALIADVAQEPGALPLLSTSLLELWRSREEATLRLSDYRRSGGVRGAVSRLAERAFVGLAPEQRPVATRLLLRLAGEEDGKLVRRRVPAGELASMPGAPRVLGALTEARLLTVDAGAVELSHEALLREWPRYRAWLEEDRVGRRLHSHLKAAAEEWETHGRDTADLYRGARLTAVLDWAAHHHAELGRRERMFLDASRREAAGEARRQRSQNRRLRLLLAGMAVLLAISLAAATIAVIKQHDATNDAHLAAAAARAALGRQLAAEATTEPRLDVALLLAREAVTLDRSPQTAGTLLSTLVRGPAVTGTFSLPTNSDPRVALSPDGRTLAVSDSEAGAIRFFDTATRRQLPPRLADYNGEQPPAYSPDGSLLAYPSGSALKVRDARTMTLVATLALDSGLRPAGTGQPAVSSILISPDAHSVYFAYGRIDAAGRPAGAYVERWSLPSGRRLATVRVGAGALLALRLSDRGARLVVVGSRSVAVLDAASLRLQRTLTLTPLPARPTAASVAPGGAAAAIGFADGSVSLLDIATGRVVGGTPASHGAVAGVIYSADGREVYSVGDDGRVVARNALTGHLVTTLAGPLGQVQNLAVGPGSRTLYTASLDGVVLAWDLTGSRRFGRDLKVAPAPPCCDPIAPRAPPLALSPDGTRMAIRVGPAAVAVLSAATLRRQATIGLRTGAPVTALAWSPDGSELAVGGHDGLVQVFNVDGAPSPVRSLAGLHLPTGLPQAVQTVAFSPDGRLVAASEDSDTSAAPETAALPVATLAIWRVATGALAGPVRELGPGNGPGGSDVLAFSPDGKLLAVSLLHGGAVIVDAATGQVKRMLPDPGDDVISLAFAPDGTLATGTLSGTVQMWNPATGSRLAAPLLAASAPIAAISFAADGTRFATSGYQDGAVKLWLTSTLQQQGPSLATAPQATSALAFSPVDGDLVAGDDIGDMIDWPTSLAAWEQRACGVGAPSLSRSQWRQYAPGFPYSTVCR